MKRAVIVHDTFETGVIGDDGCGEWGGCLPTGYPGGVSTSDMESNT